MPYAGAVFGRLNRFCIVLTVALVLVAGVAPKADAQTPFRFDWSGTLNSQSVVVELFFNANPNGGTPNLFDIVTNSASGTVRTAGTPSNILANFNTSTITNSTTAAADMQFYFAPSGPHGGNNGGSGHYDANTATNFFGFRIDTDAGNSYFIGDTLDTANNLDAVVLLSGTGAAVGVAADTAGTHTITQVPGPLAGAGWLSWLAVMLMGLVWRWQGKRSAAVGPAGNCEANAERQRLLTKIRSWLAAPTQREAPRAT